MLMSLLFFFFLAYYISFVSLQSEEFHIYTQYCTNYPRYALNVWKYFCLRSCCLKLVNAVYVVSRYYVPGTVLNTVGKLQKC